MTEEHKHSFTYVYPAPAREAYARGEFPYMVCKCGLERKIIPDKNWWVPATHDEWATTTK